MSNLPQSPNPPDPGSSAPGQAGRAMNNAASSSAAAMNPPANILIVDDEIQNIRQLEVLLRAEGYVTQTAANGEEALATIARQAPDLVLLDIMMPGMDGYAVARLLKANPATSNIPIILITALNERSARLTGLAAGAEDFLIKPIDRVELSLRVRNLLRLKALDDLRQHQNVILEQRVQARTAELQGEAAKQVAILNALPAHIALLDNQGFVISVNEVWQHFANANTLQSPDYGIGLNYITICEGAQGADASLALQVAAGIRSVLGSRLNSFSIEYPCNSPTEQRWFLMTVTPLADDPPNGVVVMHLNITERKQAENALDELSRKTERRERILNTTLSSISDFAYIFDREGRFLFANQPLLKLLGITEDRVVGKNFFDLGYPDELAAQLQRQVQEVFETNKSLTDETPFISPDGLEGFYEYIFSPGVAVDGKVEFVAGSTRDITERKTHEFALQKSESQLSEALTISRIGYWEYEFATDEFILDDQYYSLHKITAEDAGGYRMSSADFASRYVYPEDAPIVGEQIRLALEARDPDYFAKIEARILIGLTQKQV